jgi:hypothetical protein
VRAESEVLPQWERRKQAGANANIMNAADSAVTPTVVDASFDSLSPAAVIVLN